MLQHFAQYKIPTSSWGMCSMFCDTVRKSSQHPPSCWSLLRLVQPQAGPPSSACWRSPSSSLSALQRAIPLCQQACVQPHYEIRKYYSSACKVCAEVSQNPVVSRWYGSWQSSSCPGCHHALATTQGTPQTSNEGRPLHRPNGWAKSLPSTQQRLQSQRPCITGTVVFLLQTART